MSYVVQTDEAMAVEGTQLLTELATTLAPVLDAPAWHTLLKGLSIASSTDHFSAVLNPTTRSHHCLCTNMLKTPVLGQGIHINVQSHMREHTDAELVDILLQVFECIGKV